MILFLVLLLVTIILTIFVVLTAGALGAGFVIIFGDVIVCIFIIWFILRHIWKRHNDKKED